jgi:predicted transposase YdaD
MLLAFRRAHETENDMPARLEARWQLIRLMIDRRYNPEHQAHIVRLLEWVMILPEVLEKRLDELIEEYKRERGTTFVSRFEKRAIREGLLQGIEQGIQQGVQQGIQQGIQQGVAAMRDAVMRVLRRRFGEAADQVRPAIDAIDSLEVLKSLVDVALDAPTLQAFAEALPRDTSSAS